MKSILQIYSEYNIMPQLQEHQLRVAGVASLICENFIGEVDEQNIVAACLLHDMGNIIKFDLTKTASLINKDLDLNYWKKVQQEFINKFGPDEHHAHIAIAQALGVSQRVLQLIKSVSFLGAPKNAENADFGKKIVQYCDNRVGIIGVVSLEERFADLRRRYQNHGDNTPERNNFETALKEMEKQIFNQCKITPVDINPGSVDKKIEELKNFQI